MAKQLVISVSGGGALGIGPLQFMKRLEKDLGKNLGDLAVAFAGTSTGSIIASGLCSGMTADQMYKLYEEGLPKIFKKKKGVAIVQSKYIQYENSGLRDLLYKNFPGKMTDFKKPIFIPATCMDGESVEKVWDKGDAWMDRAYAIMTSCSAPTYFDVLPLEMTNKKTGKKQTYHFCDGGMWANDPIMVLQSGVQKAKIKDYKILAFNTGMNTPNCMPKSQNALGWLTYIMSDWVARTGNSNYFEACANIGEKNIFRCSPEVSKSYPMDDLDKVKEVSKIWDKYYDQVKTELLKWMKL